MIDLSRLARQIEFLVEVDKLKQVVRQTWLMDRSRRENDAEHSWHLAMFALLLTEHAAEPGIDLLRVIKMVMVHDLVEIDAGDTFAYDAVRAQDKDAREQLAADRIFAILPPDQAAEMRSLWDEFEARRTPEARYAAALDRFQPILHNYYTQGKAWQRHGITSDQVIARNRHIAEGTPDLWSHVESLIQDAVEKGYLQPGPGK
ncbi:MAG: HD domain-containing protein [Pirellulales bacterium]|nr:HD domain-containing protein [Pirellulales bacterium]